MSKDNIETEIKLVTFSNEVLSNLLEVALVKNVIVGSSKERLLESHYFDTTQRRLAKAGVVYRIRKEPEAFIATVKMEKDNSGGLSDRTEYNVPVEGLKPEIVSMGKYIDLTDVVADDKLEELFAVIVMRKQCNLQLTKATKVELAIDLGDIIAGNKKMPVAELELELITGNKKDLLDFVADLSKEIPLYSEHLSKFHRGTLLIGEDLSADSEKQEKAVGKNSKEVAFLAILQLLGEVLYGFTQITRLSEEKQYEKLEELCQKLEALFNLLSFCQVLFTKEEFTKHLSDLSDLMNKLAKTYYVFEQIRLESSEIFAVGYDKIKKDFSKAIHKGEYTCFLFSLWAFLERQKENNNIKLSDDVLLKHVEDLVKELLDLIEKGIENNLVQIIGLVDVVVVGLGLVKEKSFTNLNDLLLQLQSDLKVKKQQLQMSKISFNVLYEIAYITGVELTPEIEIFTGEDKQVSEKLLLFKQRCKELGKKINP